jgi:hypothetical protein
MRKLALSATVALCSLAGVARAQEHYTDGPVWQIAYYRIKPDKFDAYMKWVRANYLPGAAEQKKQGLILDYKVFVNAPRDEQDWDISFAALFPSYAKALDYSAADEEKSKAIAAKLFKTKDEDKQREVAAPRLEMRQFVGIRYIREVTLKPAS